MSDEKSRRSFLQKLAALTAGGVVASQGGFAMNAKKEEDMPPVIKSVRALGFQWQTQDPFLFCVHHEDFFPEGNSEMGPEKSLLQGRNIGSDFLVKDGFRMYHGTSVPGFPGHPHRGFETVTVVREGYVDHSDSQGAAGRYGNGDVQWMTAGSGLQHAEMFPLIHPDKKNTMELFQIWLNLPRKDKMVDPHFKMLWAEQIPDIDHLDGAGKKTRIEVLAGAIGPNTAPSPPPNSWAAQPEHEVGIWNIRMEPGAEYLLPAAGSGVNRTLYFYKGDELLVHDTTVPHYHAVDVQGDMALSIKAGEGKETRILVLQGRPISEPVVQHGPFVMNTRQEVQQAYNDFQRTRFGGWPWNRIDPVHDRNLGRFARHADGREEYPG